MEFLRFSRNAIARIAQTGAIIITVKNEMLSEMKIPTFDPSTPWTVPAYSMSSPPPGTVSRVFITSSLIKAQLLAGSIQIVPKGVIPT